MTLHELEIMTGIHFTEGMPPEDAKTVAHRDDITKSPNTEEKGDFFNPAILHNNYSNVPEVNSDWERYLQELAVYPGNVAGALAIRLFKEGIEQEQEHRRNTGQTDIQYTYWVRLLSDESPDGYSVEFGLRGSDRPTIPAIMARCAIENGLSSRDTSVNALEQFAAELAMIDEIDRASQAENVVALHPTPGLEQPVYAVAGN